MPQRQCRLNFNKWSLILREAFSWRRVAGQGDARPQIRARQTDVPLSRPKCQAALPSLPPLTLALTSRVVAHKAHTHIGVCLSPERVDYFIMPCLPTSPWQCRGFFFCHFRTYPKAFNVFPPANCCNIFAMLRLRRAAWNSRTM